jgi:hypothetical protein
MVPSSPVATTKAAIILIHFFIGLPRFIFSVGFGFEQAWGASPKERHPALSSLFVTQTVQSGQLY